MDVLWQSLVVITRGSLSLASWLLSVLLSISQLRLTLTFDAAGLGLLTLILCLSLWLLARYRFLNPYSRLPALGRGAGPSAPFDLHPDVVSGEEQDPSKASYPDELMGAFLSSIRVFGYLDKQVFSELARNLESRKLKAGETLFSSTKDDEIDRDFYVVVEGRVAIYVKGQRNASGKYNAAPSSDTESDDADMMDDDPEHHHLLNEVESGGTVSSLFSILSVFTESLDSALWPSKNTEDQGANEENETTEEETPLATPLAAPKLSASPMKVDSIDNGSSPPPKEDRKKSEKRARKEERPVSVHPDIIARATVDTTLAVIPARAFQQLTAKYPSAAAHIVQVILARFQRVTFMTLYRYLGLSKELLRIEKRVNEMAGAPEIAADLPDREAIDRLHRYLTRGSSSPAEDGELRAEDGIDDRASLRSRPNLKKNFSKRSSGPSQVVSSAAPHHRILPSMRESGDESDTSTIDSAPCIRRGPPLNNTSTRKRPSNGAFSHLLDEEDGDGHNTLDDEDAAAHERLRETVYDFMMRLIGAVPTEELIANAAEDGTTSQTHTSNSALPSSDLLLTPTQKRHGSVSPANTALYPRLFRRGSSRNGSSVTFPLVKKNTTLYSDGGNSTTGTASPTASSASVLGEPMIDIVFYPRGSILIKEGERLQGLYFVLDGILEASMRGNVNPTDTLTNLDEVPSRKSLFFVTTGGLAGYLAAITGHPSFITIEAKTDCCIGFMPKASLDLHVEKFPSILLYLAKRLVSQLSPLVLHIDVALEWGQLNAGQILCRQGDDSNSIYIVLTGRLRSIAERNRSDGTMGLEILGEFGQGESVGEMEVLTNTKRPSTIHAIRDTEIAIMPSTLFNALSLRHPEITMAIARIIATRSNERQGGRSDVMPDVASIGNGPESGNNNVNLKTVAIIPVTGLVPIVEFAERLREAFGLIGASVALLNTSSVTSTLGKHAFTRIGRLKLLSWLAEQEESHRLVLYVADGGVNAPWTQRCVRQADCVLLVGLGDEDPGIGEFERLLIGMKTTARKELVLLHAERYCIPGSTSQWLKNRLWIHAHHHVQMRLKTQKMFSTNERKGTFSNLQQHLSQYYPGNPLHARKSSSPNIFGGVRSDFARVARRLLNKSVGLVLGGGGARGLSHIGIIRALEEAGIPIDMVGGTSIGSFVGGLYARENDHVSVFGRGKMFSGQVASKWRQILDLTYPVTSMFTGHAFNRAVWKCFSDTLIEDCWLPYFAVTTNITWSRMEVHKMGYMWRYVRASMSLSGYLPPLCDNGNMLLDGGYLNNLPADIMQSLGAATIIAVDVGRVDDTSPVNYGDSLSGWWVLLNRWNPFGHKYGKIPQMADIQSRIAYVSSVKSLEAIKKIDGVIYVHPDVNRYNTLEFERFHDIFEVGYRTGKALLERLNDDGTLEKRFNVTLSGTPKPGRRNRRASI